MALLPAGTAAGRAILFFLRRAAGSFLARARLSPQRHAPRPWRRGAGRPTRPGAGTLWTQVWGIMGGLNSRRQT